MEILASLFLSYLLGSIPVSYLVGKVWKKDLFREGSGNIGTANVWRATKNFFAAFLAFLGDSGKGILAIFLTKRITSNPQILMLSAFFAVLGHNFSLFLKFRGGRGLATLAGILLFLNWKAFFLAIFALFFSILFFEAIRSPKLELGKKPSEILKNLFPVLISQVLGRVVGICLAIFLVFKFYPLTFQILIPGVLLSILKHWPRLKSFLKGEKV